MIDNGKLKSFVQNTLGCGCPEEVFRSIDVRSYVRLSDDIVVNTAITIGDRLLVYVIGPIAQDVIQQQMNVLVAAGKQERDSRGLNRFRLVVVADGAFDQKSLQSQFEELRGTDEKIHLHIISKEQDIFSAMKERQSA